MVWKVQEPVRGLKVGPESIYYISKKCGRPH